MNILSEKISLKIYGIFLDIKTMLYKRRNFYLDEMIRIKKQQVFLLESIGNQYKNSFEYARLDLLSAIYQLKSEFLKSMGAK